MLLEIGIDRFLSYLTAERGLAENTVRAYRIDLEQFALVALQRGARQVEDLLESHALAWIAQLQERGAAENSIARKMGALHHFARFLVIEGARKDDFMAGIRGRKRPKSLPRTLSVAKVKQLLHQVDPADPRSLRDKALCELLYASGLRVSELTALTVDDLDLDAGTVRCYGKGGKERIVPVGKVACDYLALYLAQRRAIATGALPAAPAGKRHSDGPPTREEARSPYLFPNRRGEPIARQAVR